MEKQEKVKSFVEKYNLEISIQSRYIDLVSEIGEVGKEILKLSNYGKNEIIADSDIENELGDVVFSLLCLSNSLNISVEKSLDKALEKYRMRFDEKGHIGSNV